MSTTLFLIRHGETEWNRSGRWQGHTDVPLTDRGRSQAQALARRLHAERIPIERIYASDLSRALETAQIIGQALNTPVDRLADLREIHVGSWSGLTRAEIMQRFPGAFETVWHAHDGETREALSDRVVGALLRLIDQHPAQSIAIVSHGGPIRAIVQYLYERQGLPVEAVPHIGNTSITEAQIDGDSYRLLRVNDIAHVDGEQAPDMLAPPNEGSAAAR